MGSGFCVLLEVRILLDDGSEIPSRLELKDPDLDLAFVKPMEGSEELKTWLTACPNTIAEASFLLPIVKLGEICLFSSNALVNLGVSPSSGITKPLKISFLF